ncbi:MAG TPA: response regulator, partial [Vicinamibacterales bacterium]|nr:response regulator [Vicinamibacterales bacterium]
MLVLDDHRLVDGLRVLLIADDVHVTFARTPAEALSAARDHEFDLALVTLDTEAGESSRARALELIALLSEDSPSLSIVAIGPPGSSELASEARRLGARDVVPRPWDDLRMLALVRAQAELGRSRRRLAALETENRELRSRDVVGAPPPLMKVRAMEEELVQQA